MKNSFLAIDLGEGYGRAVLGELTDGILSLHEIHSFIHEPVFREEHGYRNTDLMFGEIKKTLSVVADKDLPIESIGICGWGSDFALMGDDGVPMAPFVTDDIMHEGSLEAFTARMSVDKIYGQTGVPVLPGNTLFQLYALKLMGSEPLKKAKHLLFVPDIFNYLLTGVILTEFSMAATSQLYNPIKRMWDHDFFRTLGVSTSIMSRIAEPGSVIGSVSNKVSYETGIARIPVVAVASHQLASAVASIPASGNTWAYIVMGSHCQIGFESATAVITKKSQQLGFANLGGAGHTFLISKSFAGLSLLEGCRQAWKENDYTQEEMEALAAGAKPFAAFIDTDHPSLLKTDDMPAAIATYCESTGQDVPQAHGENIRAILEGLAFKFRLIVREIEALRGIRTEALYLSGSGAGNELLCRFTADCCGIPVIAVLNDATVTGNILIQAAALGIVKSLAEIREISGRSFPSKTYMPEGSSRWDTAFEEYAHCTI